MFLTQLLVCGDTRRRKGNKRQLYQGLKSSLVILSYFCIQQICIFLLSFKVFFFLSINTETHTKREREEIIIKYIEIRFYLWL